MEKSKKIASIVEIENIYKCFKQSGIIRKLDNLGRIVIPVEHRKKYGYKQDDEMTVYRIHDWVIVRNVYDENRGITRQVDDLGRIVIPKEFRDLLGWKEQDRILIVIYKDVMLLRKANYNCQVCQGDKKLFEISGKWICKKCAKEIARISIQEVFSKKELEDILNNLLIYIK